MDVSPADGRRYCAHVRTREDVRLIDLAHDVRETGGPLAELVGTPGSLAALWSWQLAQARNGFAYLPAGTRSARAIALAQDPSIDSRPMYAGETIAHYLAIVISGYLDHLTWEPKPIPPKTADSDQNEPMLVSPGARSFAAEKMGVTLGLNAAEKLPAAFEPGTVRRRVESWLGQEFWAGVRRDAFALAPLADIPRPPADDPRRSVPVLSAAQEVDDGRRPRGGPLRVVPPTTSTGFEPDALLRALTPDWRRADGNPVDLDSLQGAADLRFREGVAALTTHIRSGRVYALTVQPLAMTDEEWADLCAWLAAIDEQLGAHVRTEDF